MANFRVITSLLSYTPTADSADSNWPVANLNVLSDLDAKWQAAVATGVVNVTLDLGAGNTLSGLAANPGILIDDVNVTSLRIQGNSVTTDWVTPPWDQGVTIARCRDTRRYKGFIRLADLSASAVAYRYVNIRILSQTPTDGTNYRISRVALGQITELLQNPLYQSRYDIPQERIDTKLATGGRTVNLMGPRRMLLQYPRAVWGTAEIDQESAIQAITAGDPIVLWDSSRGAGGSQSAWLVRRTDDPQYTTTFLDMDDTTWTFEEVI